MSSAAMSMGDILAHRMWEEPSFTDGPGEAPTCLLNWHRWIRLGSTRRTGQGKPSVLAFDCENPISKVGMTRGPTPWTAMKLSDSYLGGREGIHAWNDGRDADENIPDLSAADFSGAFLSDANLSRVNFIGANFSDADLSRANFFEAALNEAYLVEAHLNEAYLVMAKLAQAHIRRAQLTRATLFRADLSGADLTEANLSDADLSDAKLMRANLTDALLSRANLDGANLIEANLSRADLCDVNLRGADLRHAKLPQANLVRAVLVNVDLRGTILSECRIFGVSVWAAKTDLQTEQNNLIVSNPSDPVLTVDNLEVAQFIYLLLNNAKIRDVIDTITSKVVLILGRFSAERKVLFRRAPRRIATA